MIIKEITFENFRPYRGECKVEISTSADRNVTLIHGENGQGKTSFFTGLNWCLYGDAAVPKTELGEKELVNKGVLFEANQFDRIVCSVTMKFTRDDEQYIVYRSKTVSKKGKPGSIEYTVVDTDFYIQQPSKSVEKLYRDEAQEILNVILPENVRTYFFFDGERINAFAEAKPEEIGMAVRNILKLDLLTRAKDHLSAVSRELQSEAKPYISEEMQELISKMEAISDQKDLIAAKREQKKAELDSCRKLLSDVTAELEGMKEVQAQMARRRMLEDRLQESERELKDSKKELNNFLSKSYRLVANQAFKEAKEIIRKATKDVNLQDSRAIKEIAKKIFETQHCMFCDRDIEKEDRSRLLSMFTNESNSQFEYADLSSLESDIENSIQDQKRTYRDLTECYKKYRDIMDKVEKVKADIKRIDDENMTSPHQTVQDLSQQRDRLIRAEVRLESEIEVCSADIEKLNVSKNALAEERKSRSRLVDEAQGKLEQSDLADQCIQELESIYDSFAEQMRLRIQEETTHIFKMLLIKQQQFDRVELDEKYSLVLIDRYGSSAARIDISAAESQTLGLSFILGLAEVSECGAPLVIDTPFGRFSERLKRNVLRQLPKLVPQLILFVTDSEIGAEEHAILSECVEHEYTLINDDATGNTSILEGRQL